MARSEKQKMLANEPYLASDSELSAQREIARTLCAALNAAASSDRNARAKLLHELLGGVGQNVCIESPFHCDYGSNIFLGDGVFINCSCVILDCNTVHIDNAAKLGPCVQIYTAYHPIEPAMRRSGIEMAAPIRIGENAWIGGGAIICPGVTIGENSVIGAGSVVTRSIESNVVAAGNPCRVLRAAT